MNQNEINNQMESAKTFAFEAGIVAVIAGILWCFTGVGILWAWIDIIGGILLIRSKGFTNEKFASKSTGLLVFGLLFLVTTFLGGILALVAYFKLNGVKDQVQTAAPNFMDLEKAHELKTKGVLSDEEFEKIKVQSLR